MDAAAGFFLGGLFGPLGGFAGGVGGFVSGGTSGGTSNGTSSSGGNNTSGTPVPPGTSPDNGGGDQTFLPSRGDGATGGTNQHSEESTGYGNSTQDGIFQSRYSNRPRRADRGWFGTLKFEAGADPFPTRPDLGWFGKGPITDQGLLDDIPDKPDYTTLAETTQTTQDEHDTVSPIRLRTDQYNKINQTSEAVVDLDCRDRARYEDDLGVQSIASGGTFMVVTTTHPSTGAVEPSVQITVKALSTSPFYSVSQNANLTWDITITVPFTNPGPGAVEMSVAATYAVAAATEIGC